jgi:uncharacterized protein (TIGR04255 family)
MSSYIPNTAEHAVETVVLGLRLHARAFESSYAAAKEVASKLADDFELKSRSRLDAAQFLSGRQPVSLGYSNTADILDGFCFQLVDSEFTPVSELVLEPSSLSFRTKKYSRWADIVECINGIFLPVAEALTENDVSRISVSELRCIDRFTVSSPAKVPLSELIRQDSPYFPRDLLGRSELLHQHTGWFQDVTESSRILVNVNLDLMETKEGLRNVLLNNLISFQLKDKQSNFFEFETVNEAVANSFNWMHRFNKHLLSKMLTDEIQNRIDLKGSSGVEMP